MEIDQSPFQYIEGESPVLLELPHGGHLTPDEVKPYLHPKFTPGDRREDADEFSDALYLDLPSKPHVLRFRFWRAHADPNRRYDDFSADGVVKTHTSQGVKIYQSERGMPETVRQAVIERYVMPHQQQMLALLANPSIKQVLFCHTMPGIGTSVSKDRGNLRPLFMFGNGGDLHGKPHHNCYAHKKTLELMSSIIEDHFHELDVGFNFCDVIRCNNPYSGINSLGRFTCEQFKGKHPFTLEINRDLLLHNPENIIPVRHIIDLIVQALAAGQA
ncbi:N-formylglutamate amidohydrolase [Thiothrix subterranea]|uniref:N-formylglutamate amidohydrolase n=1 Tax=Thiothrix subterranea TaxID=2735563 RepID=UPI00192A9DEF|nr:N-formylglutamate amidohydrolase [Thiothrix subterranea]QQZ28361.1 N-formylglutamate amidohydrolase [Thiothrix subterranea]